MRRALEISCLLVGGVMMVLGVAALLWLGHLGPTFLAGGVAGVVLGFGVFSAVRFGRTAAARGALAVGLMATLGSWAAARYFNAEASIEAPGDSPKVALAKNKVENGQRRLTLDETLEITRQALAAVSKYKDYTGTISKREWCKKIGGEFRLTKERATIKLRHEPFGVYLHFSRPESKRGTEALFAADKNGGNIIAHTTEFPGSLLGTLDVKPSDWRVMLDNRYPISTIGMKNLLVKFHERAEQHKDVFASGTITMLEGKDVEKVDGRECVCLDFRVPQRHPDLPLAVARLFLDKEWNVPVRYEAFEYPSQGRNKTSLVEQYIYTNVKFNQGLGDKDFDRNNPKYDF